MQTPEVFGIRYLPQDQAISYHRAFVCQTNEGSGLCDGAGPAVRKVLGALRGLVNFIVTSFWLPAFWTPLALGKSARVSLLAKAIPTGWTYFKICCLGEFNL